MSSISIDIPHFQIDGRDLQNFIRFIYKHERLLKEFGAIKVQLSADCRLALQKRRKNIALCKTVGQIERMKENDPIYCVRHIDHTDETVEQNALLTDAFSFWSSLSRQSSTRHKLNTSILPGISFFCQKKAQTNFDIHRLPRQSLLKLGGTELTRRLLPNVRRAHGPGAIFPLASVQQYLFSVNYHHEGGAQHWYIIPSCEREALRSLVELENSSICLDHERLLIDPTVLDKNHIRHYRTIQYPNEFMVLSAGTLTQSFSEGANWSESIAFALPSWIEDGYAMVLDPICQCNFLQDSLIGTIDINLFRKEQVQRYITSYLNISYDDQRAALEGIGRRLE